MRKRRSMTHREQVTTLAAFIAEKRWTQRAFIAWLDSKGILITVQHLNDVLHGRRNPGPKFREVFQEITGITLVDGLIEDKEGQ